MGAMAGKSQRKRKRSSVSPIVGIVVGLAILAAPILTDLYARWQNANTISTMTFDLRLSEEDGLTGNLDASAPEHLAPQVAAARGCLAGDDALLAQRRRIRQIRRDDRVGILIAQLTHQYFAKRGKVVR